MKHWSRILIVAFGVFLLTLAACGKKAPPFLPERVMVLRVDRLNAGWEKGAVVLRGSVVDPQGRPQEGGNIIGCRVYHSRYSTEDAPCEGCPIEYGGFKVIKGGVITKEGFHCPVPGIEEEGIHFFEVRLIGRDAGVGAPSNRAKLRIDE